LKRKKFDVHYIGQKQINLDFGSCTINVLSKIGLKMALGKIEVYLLLFILFVLTLVDYFCKQNVINNNMVAFIVHEEKLGSRNNVYFLHLSDQCIQFINIIQF